MRKCTIAALILLSASIAPAIAKVPMPERVVTHMLADHVAAAKSKGELAVTTAPPIVSDTQELPEAYRSLASLRARDDLERERGYKFPKIIRGNTKRKEIALTFDDGPHRMYTLKLLEVLKQTHTRATFFLVGKQVEKFPTLAQLEVIEGHELGNHTYDHVNLSHIPPDRIGYELDQCDKAIQRAVGTGTRLFRPPGGDYDDDVVREATRRNYITALWTCDPGDFAKPGSDVILQRCLDRMDNGTVFLLHDGIPETIAMLPTLIAMAKARGYTFVTLSELVRP